MATIELKITLDDEAKKIRMEGPLDNESVCYYLLEKARQKVQEIANQREHAQLQIIPVKAIPLVGRAR